ncbi:MAG: DUF1257 domain-containing protein [bacterium]
MSVVMVIAPLVTASWPIISTAVCSAATSCGFTMLKQGFDDRPQAIATEETVEMELDNSEVFKESLKNEKKLEFKKDDLTLTFYADEHGKYMLRIKGDRKTKAQLQQIGKQMMNRFTQQFAYHKVVSELKKKGYAVATEEMLENKTVRVVVRRFS